MATNGNPVVARPGWPFIALLLVLAVAAKVFVGWTVGGLVLVLALAVVFLFRDPPRVIPSAPLAVVSPASGQVVGIDTVTDPWLKRPARQVRIRMSILDVHSLRSPIEGKVMDQWSSEPQEPGVRRRYTYHIRTDEGDDVVLSLAMGVQALIVRLTLSCGNRIGQGQPCGYLFFAGAVDLYLPDNTKLEVKSGDRIDSGTAVIGRLVHKRPPETAA